jgi:hypothetical protein
VRPYIKNNQSKKGWGMTQVVEHFTSKCEAQNSNPSTAKREKEKRKKAQ